MRARLNIRLQSAAQTPLEANLKNCWTALTRALWL